MEEREASASKRQAHANQLEGLEFNQDQEGSAFAQQFGGRGGNVGRGRGMQRGNFGYNRGFVRGTGRGRGIIPPKYPMDQDAFDKAMGKLKPGNNPQI